MPCTPAYFVERTLNDVTRPLVRPITRPEPYRQRRRAPDLAAPVGRPRQLSTRLRVIPSRPTFALRPLRVSHLALAQFGLAAGLRVVLVELTTDELEPFGAAAERAGGVSHGGPVKPGNAPSGAPPAAPVTGTRLKQST